MKEKLIFVMPESLEQTLFASVVVSQYLISRLVMGRVVDDVIIACRFEGVHRYLKACWEFAEVVTEPTQEQLDQADLVFEFDAARAYSLTKAVQKNMSESFAIMLGVGLMRFLPPVLVEDRPEEVGTLLVAERNKMDGVGTEWSWPFREEFIEVLHTNNVPVTFLSSGAGWDEIRAAVGRASVVVGVRSSVTLIAAAANRLVLELCPEDEGHKDWCRKKECRTCRMIYGKLEQIAPQFVWMQLEKMIREVKGIKPEPVMMEV